MKAMVFYLRAKRADACRARPYVYPHPKTTFKRLIEIKEEVAPSSKMRINSFGK